MSEMRSIALLAPVLFLACSSSESTPAAAGGAGGGAGSGGVGGAGGGVATQCAYPTDLTADRATGRVDSTQTFGAAPTPRRVRVGVGGAVGSSDAAYADPAHTAAVVWDTDVDTQATDLRIGTSEAALDATVSGFSYLLAGSVPTRVHQVHLCGLTASTTYYYQVGGGTAWSDVRALTTLPAAGAADSVTIGVSGDARDSLDVVWPAVQGRLRAATPSFQVFTGDVSPIALANSEDDYGKWLDGLWAAGTASGVQSSQPLFAIGGNHEHLQAQWLANFAFPGTGAYQGYFYSFDAGPAHVVVLDDFAVSASVPDTGAQPAILEFLDKDLAAADARRATVPFVVVFHHKGELSTSNHASDSDVARMRPLLMPVWDAHHVDLVLNGHDHNYERSTPATWSGSAPAVAGAGQGTTYIVCAGAGASAYAPGDGSEAYSAKRARFGASTSYVGLYGLLTVGKTTMSWKAYGLKSGGTRPEDDDVIDTQDWTR